MLELVEHGNRLACGNGGFGFVYRHHGHAHAVADQIDNGLREIADNLVFGREAVAAPELLEVFAPAREAGHFNPGIVFQVGGIVGLNVGGGFCRADQAIADVFEKQAADAAVVGGTEIKAALQGFILHALENFAAHAVLDVQLQIGVVVLDAAGEGGDAAG